MIVTKKIGAQKTGAVMEVASIETIVGKLLREDRLMENVGEFLLFSEEELRRAVQSVQNKKALGRETRVHQEGKRRR